MGGESNALSSGGLSDLHIPLETRLVNFRETGKALREWSINTDAATRTAKQLCSVVVPPVQTCTAFEPNNTNAHDNASARIEKSSDERVTGASPECNMSPRKLIAEAEKAIAVLDAQAAAGSAWLRRPSGNGGLRAGSSEIGERREESGSKDRVTQPYSPGEAWAATASRIRKASPIKALPQDALPATVPELHQRDTTELFSSVQSELLKSHQQIVLRKMENEYRKLCDDNVRMILKAGSVSPRERSRELNDAAQKLLQEKHAKRTLPVESSQSQQARPHATDPLRSNTRSTPSNYPSLPSSASPAAPVFQRRVSGSASPALTRPGESVDRRARLGTGRFFMHSARQRRAASLQRSNAVPPFAAS